MDLLAPGCVSTERKPVSMPHALSIVIFKKGFSLCTKQILQCLLIYLFITFSLPVGSTFAIIPALMHYLLPSSGVCVDHIDHRPD